MVFGTSAGDASGDHRQHIPVLGYDHELYVPGVSGHLSHDIAVLELEYPVTVDNFTRPVCLGTEETLQFALSQSSPECYATGFGLTEHYFNGRHYHFDNLDATSDIQQCSVLTSIDSDEPVRAPFKLRNSK